MTLSSKEPRPVKASPRVEDVSLATDDDFDFGDPEILPVEIAPGKFLELKEPSANDMIEIMKLEKRKDMTEIENTLGIICILHYPGERGVRLNMRQAKRLTARQVRILSKAMWGLMGVTDPKVDDEEEGQEEDDIKSEEEL